MSVGGIKNGGGFDKLKVNNVDESSLSCCLIESSHNVPGTKERLGIFRPLQKVSQSQCGPSKEIEGFKEWLRYGQVATSFSVLSFIRENGGHDRRKADPVRVQSSRVLRVLRLLHQHGVHDSRERYVLSHRFNI